MQELSAQVEKVKQEMQKNVQLVMNTDKNLNDLEYRSVIYETNDSQIGIGTKFSNLRRRINLVSLISFSYFC